MFQQVIPHSFLWLVILSVALIIGIIGCGGDDDDNDWVGTWEIDTVDGQSFEQTFDEELGEGEINVSVVNNNWTFNDDGTIEAETQIKIEGGQDGSEITATISQNATGTYSLSGSTYTLTLEITINFFGETETETDEDTGTWSRSGNTLTLNSDDGETIVFKKEIKPNALSYKS